MTTHLRARVAQAGALLAVVVGGIAAAPAVAHASPPDVEITSLATEVLSGSTVTMAYRIANTDQNGNGQRAPAAITVSGMPCTGDCNQIASVDPGGKEFTARLSAPQVAAGDTKQVAIQVSATMSGETGSASSALTVKGPDKPRVVTQISGKVRDQNGNAISGAAVAMRDSAGNAYSTTTNGSGGYSFQSSESRPIMPGNISVGALKDGYQQATVQVHASPGRSVTVPLTLKKVAAAPTTSPTATASPTAAVAPSAEATEVAPTDEQTPAATGTQQTAARDDSGSSSLLFILLGALLVAAGVGAIVLVLMRRKNNPDDDMTGFGGGGGAVPPSQGRYADPTRVAAPVGAGHDATMLAPQAAASPLADAPTMLQRPVPAEDEFPDPYGAPIPPQGGYAGSGGWNDQGAGYGAPTHQYGGGYAEPTQYGAPNNGYDAYGSPAAGGYGGGGDQRRYDEPTGLYRPEPEHNDGYGAYDQGGGYGGGQQYGGGAGGAGYPGGYQSGGYGDQAPGGDQGGYGSWGGDGGNAYGQQSTGNYGGGAYGGASHGGRGQQYGSGYDQSGGYGGQDNYVPQDDNNYGGTQNDNNYGGTQDGGYRGYDRRPGHGGQRPPN